MAAYDLQVQRPGMLQVPNTLNQGASNLMQFMRSQQERRNQEDRLKLEQIKTNDQRAFNQDRLKLDETRTNNQLQDTLADNARADSNLEWLKGAPEREKKSAIDLNQAFQGATESARTELGKLFQITDSNLKALQSDKRFLQMSDEDQQLFKDKYTEKMRGNIGKILGKSKYEQALRKSYSNTQGTPEQIDARVKSEIDRVYPGQDDVVTKLMLSNMGYNSNGTKRKVDGLDDVGNIVDEQKYVDNWKQKSAVESGSRGWFGNLFDVWDTDLTDQNTAQYIDQMKKRGFNAVEALTALEVTKDNDTVGDGFEAFLSGKVTDSFKSVLSAAQSAKNLKAQASNSQNGNMAGMLSSLLNSGAPVTEMQRREILLGMLPQIQAARNPESTTDTASIVKALTGETIGAEAIQPNQAVYDNIPPDNQIEMLQQQIANASSPSSTAAGMRSRVRKLAVLNAELEKAKRAKMKPDTQILNTLQQQLGKAKQELQRDANRSTRSQHTKAVMQLNAYMNQFK